MAKKKITSELLIEQYIDALLVHPEQLHSIYKFTKALSIEEGVFYEHFSSFEDLESTVFVQLFEATLATLHDTEGYEQFDSRNKLLSFYYTLFENFKLNRSAIVALLDGSPSEFMGSQKKLKEFKKLFKRFIETLDFKSNTLDIDQINKLENFGITNTAWIHFMTLMKYWLEDTSKNFEQTDVLIEKSVNTGLDIVESNTLGKILDLGKFILKDKLS